MPRRIKLLLAIPHLGGGGAERVTWLLARHLSPERFDIHLALITPDQPGSHPLPPHVTIHRLYAPRICKAWRPLVRLIRTLRPEVILSNMAHLNFLLLLLKPLIPRQTVLLVRQNATASTAAHSALERFLYRHLYPFAEAILCQSQEMAQDLADNFGIQEHKLEILHNPVEIHIPQPSPAAIPTLLAVGRLSFEKGLDMLLTAFAQLRQSCPQLSLIVLGIGPEHIHLVRLAQSLGIAPHVRFSGHTDPGPYYASATLFVLPSRHEGMPNALLEAAACGLPIVATPCSGGVSALLAEQPGTWLTPEITAASLVATLHLAMTQLQTLPNRFEHAFLAPFRMKTAIAAYEAKIAYHARGNHVAFIIPTVDQIGGAERQVLLLSKGLAARGWRVTLIALNGTGTLQFEDLRMSGIEYFSLEMRKAWIDPRGWLRYLRWVRHNRPSILHTHLPHATWFARCIRPLAPIRALVDTIHTSHTGPKSRQIIYRLTSLFSDHITCVSQAVASAGVAHPGKSSVIPNGIPLQRKQTPISQAAKNTRQTFRWIAVGRLSAVKDYPTLLKAFVQLPSTARLTILGTGQEETHLRVLAVGLGIADRVHFVGFQQDVQPWLAGSDAFVLSSLWEGLPIGVLEAAVAGLPIVATDGPGTSEALPPGGLLVPVGDASALAAAMAQIQTISSTERQILGARARQFADEKYALPKVLDQWEDLYAQLLRESPSPTRRSHRSPDSVTKSQQPSTHSADTDPSQHPAMKQPVPPSPPA